MFYLEKVGDLNGLVLQHISELDITDNLVSDWSEVNIYSKALAHIYIIYIFVCMYHTGLTRVSSIRFLLFEIKRVMVFNSIIIYFTDLFILYIFIQNAYASNKAFEKKG